MATLLHRQKSSTYIHSKAKQCGLDLTGERYGVSVLTLHMDGDVQKEKSEGVFSEPSQRHNPTTSEVADQSEIFVPGGSLRQSEDAELKRFVALNIAAEVWAEHGAGHAFMHQETIVLLYVDRTGGTDGAKRQQKALENVMRKDQPLFTYPGYGGLWSDCGYTRGCESCL